MFLLTTAFLILSQVPADGILISGHSLAIDESSMTGESKIVIYLTYFIVLFGSSFHCLSFVFLAGSKGSQSSFFDVWLQSSWWIWHHAGKICYSLSSLLTISAPTLPSSCSYSMDPIVIEPNCSYLDQINCWSKIVRHWLHIFRIVLSFWLRNMVIWNLANMAR